MIINTNKVILEDSSLELNDTIIVATAFNGLNNSATHSVVTLQIAFYATAEKFLQSIGNSLKIKGFDKSKRLLTFNYPITDKNVFLYFDKEIKEHIMNSFPYWDADKLVLTTETIEE